MSTTRRKIQFSRFRASFRQGPVTTRCERRISQGGVCRQFGRVCCCGFVMVRIHSEFTPCCALVLWTPDISRYNITRYCTRHKNLEGKTSVTLRTYQRHPYFPLTVELWVSCVSYLEESGRDVSEAHCTCTFHPYPKGPFNVLRQLFCAIKPVRISLYPQTK